MRMVYPPRPAGKMRPEELQDYETKGWVAQRKFNGLHIVVKLKDGSASIYTQDGKVPTKFKLSQDMERQLLSLADGPEEIWLDGELMVARQADVKYGDHYRNKIILFDVLVHKGKHLFRGPTLLQRMKLLKDLCGPAELEPCRGIALKVTEDVWLAETFEGNLAERFEDFHTPILEGLMLKRPDSTLDNLGGRPHEVRWMIRCRVPSVSYSF